MRRRQLRTPAPRAVLAALIGIVAVGGGARALTDEEVFREFTFSFINPGPRALGMGGAFSAVADDVTAVRANPAGLHYVTGTDAFVEFRSIDRDTRITTSDLGSLAVDPDTGDRELPFLGLTSVAEAERSDEPTFVGAAHSVLLGQPGRRLTAAVSRHVVWSDERRLASDREVTAARFAFDSFPNTVNGNTVEAYSVETQVSGASKTEIVYWSAGASFEIHRDFSIGATVSHATLDLQMNTTTRVVDPLELFLDPQNPRLPAQPVADVFESGIDDSDSDLAFTVGLHWHPDSIFGGGTSPWRVAAVYRKGATFEVDESTLVNGSPDETFVNRIVVPDRYGIGIDYTVRRYWRVAVEVERVEYSDMLDGFRSGVNFLTSGRLADGAFGVDPDAAIEYDVDDETIPRAGVEYARALSQGGSGIRFQAGYYRQPAGRIHMRAFNSDDPDVNATYLDAFRAGEDVDHFTAGAGYGFGRMAVQIAGDFSDDGTQLVGAFVYSIKRP